MPTLATLHARVDHLEREWNRRHAELNRKVDRLMSTAEDLNNSVATLATAFADLDNAVHAELDKIALAPGLTDAAKQAVANIAAITSKMSLDAAALTATIPAATTIPPAMPNEPPVDMPANVTPPAIPVPKITAMNATPPNEAAPAQTAGNGGAGAGGIPG